MITFLFWNLNKKHLEQSIKNLADNFNVDVFMFAECDIPPDRLLRTLNRDSAFYYYSPKIGCDKITILTRFSPSLMQPKKETYRLTIRHLTLPGLRDILLGVMHLPSKLYWSAKSQASECFEIANIVKAAELEIGHSRTILVGDFNMNPYEEGFASANGLNAVMCRDIALRQNRKVQKREYPFFYNPMWNHFGDETPGPPGTYYYDVREHVGYFWNMFDQVLLRPALLGCVGKNSTKILDSDGKQSLLSSSGIPNSNILSDHLPILFRINL